MAYIYDLSDTWNAGATVFTGIKLSVTDTASAAGSLLMDLQVGGVSRFNVSKAGTIQVPGVTEQSILATGTAGGNAAIRWRTGNRLVFSTGDNGQYLPIEAASIWIGGLNRLMSMGSAVVRFTNYTDTGYAQVQADSFSLQTDTILARDAANTLAQRNGVNAQAFNLYNTYTDASNYERGVMKWASNVLSIGTEAAGTGSGRITRIVAGGVARAEFWSGTGYIDYLAGAGSRFYSTGIGGTSSILAFIATTGGAATSGFVGGISFAASAFGWSAGQPTGADSGLIRTAAAKLKVTDGSTGTGQLIFIVPTTDPGITGALWNNAGTLAISA